MVATPQTFVATTIGRVAIPKLADTLVRTGADKFVKVYGQKAFEAVLGTAIGARAYSKTEEYISEYLNHIDTGGDENSFVPKGSMPTATRAEQMDAVMAVPNTTAFANNNNEGKEEETTGTELSTEVKEEPPKLPKEPPKGPDIGTELATEAAVQTTKKLLEDKKPDISKQTKDLVPEKPEFGKLTKTEIQTAKALKGGSPDFYSRAIEAIKTAKYEARVAEDEAMMEIAEAQTTPADKYQSYVAAMGIQLLRDSKKFLRAPRTIKELSELDQLIRRNMGLNAKTGGGSGKVQIDISILNNTKADRGGGALKVNTKEVIDVEPEE